MFEVLAVRHGCRNGYPRKLRGQARNLNLSSPACNRITSWELSACQHSGTNIPCWNDFGSYLLRFASAFPIHEIFSPTTQMCQADQLQVYDSRLLTGLTCLALQDSDSLKANSFDYSSFTDITTDTCINFKIWFRTTQKAYPITSTLSSIFKLPPFGYFIFRLVLVHCSTSHHLPK